jgi:hypothetical protein
VFFVSSWFPIPEGAWLGAAEKGVRPLFDDRIEPKRGRTLFRTSAEALATAEAFGKGGKPDTTCYRYMKTPVAFSSCTQLAGAVLEVCSCGWRAKVDQTVPAASESEGFGTFAPSRSNYLVSRPSGSRHKSRARRPDRKARRASIQAVCERGATQRGGMPRPGIMSRTTGTGY